MYDLDELDKLDAAASPWPWNASSRGDLAAGWDVIVDDIGGEVLSTPYMAHGPKCQTGHINAQLTARLRNAYPAMAARIRALEAALAKVSGQIPTFGNEPANFEEAKELWTRATVAAAVTMNNAPGADARRAILVIAMGLSERAAPAARTLALEAEVKAWRKLGQNMPFEPTEEFKESHIAREIANASRATDATAH